MSEDISADTTTTATIAVATPSPNGSRHRATRTGSRSSWRRVIPTRLTCGAVARTTARCPIPICAASTTTGVHSSGALRTTMAAMARTATWCSKPSEAAPTTLPPAPGAAISARTSWRFGDTSADDTRGGARELGDITGLDAVRFPRNTLDGDGDRVDYYRFQLSETKQVGLGVRRQDAVRTCSWRMARDECLPAASGAARRTSGAMRRWRPGPTTFGWSLARPPVPTTTSFATGFRQRSPMRGATGVGGAGVR